MESPPARETARWLLRDAVEQVGDVYGEPLAAAAGRLARAMGLPLVRLLAWSREAEPGCRSFEALADAADALVARALRQRAQAEDERMRGEEVAASRRRREARKRAREDEVDVPGLPRRGGRPFETPAGGADALAERAPRGQADRAGGEHAG